MTPEGDYTRWLIEEANAAFASGEIDSKELRKRVREALERKPSPEKQRRHEAGKFERMREPGED